jgi:uncharacterized protein (DUF433 family)
MSAMSRLFQDITENLDQGLSKEEIAKKLGIPEYMVEEVIKYYKSSNDDLMD